MTSNLGINPMRRRPPFNGDAGLTGSSPEAAGMTRTLYIPACSREIALKLAYLVEAGKVPCLGQYLDEARATYSAEVLTQVHAVPHRAFCVVLETRTHDDGLIPVARIVEGVGSLAAALMIVIGGCWAVGFGSIL